MATAVERRPASIAVEGLTLVGARRGLVLGVKGVTTAPAGPLHVPCRGYRRGVPRPLRRDLGDGIYHVTARSVARTDLFADDLDRVTFVRLLAGTAARHGWGCEAFCLMGTHYHLILATSCARLSRGLHRLNGVYAQGFNRRHRRSGHLFGSRFSSWLVESDDHLREACRYVLLNPVRAGLCARPEDWPWSGSRSGRSPR